MSALMVAPMSHCRQVRYLNLSDEVGRRVVASFAADLQQSRGGALHVAGSLREQNFLAAFAFTINDVVTRTADNLGSLVAPNRVSTTEPRMLHPAVAVSAFAVNHDSGNVRNLVTDCVRQGSEVRGPSADFKPRHGVAVRVRSAAILDAAHRASSVRNLEVEGTPHRQATTVYGVVDMIVGVAHCAVDLLGGECHKLLHAPGVYKVNGLVRSRARQRLQRRAWERVAAEQVP